MTTSSPDNVQGQYIEANGLRIYYTEQGAGRPLLLIHGGVSTGTSWQPYAETFAEHFRVIMPDSRAHGRTNNPTGTLSAGLMAEDMVALIAALGLEQPLVFGYSDGGQIAVEIGMRYPDLVKAFVVGGAYAELTEGARQWAASILGDPDSPEVDVEAFERDNPGFAYMLRTEHTAVNWHDLLRQIKPMWTATLGYTPDDFARIIAPTLVVIGDRDQFVPVEEAARLYRALPNAALTVVANTDHIEMVDSPQHIALTRSVILDFLLRHDADDPVNP